MHILSQEYRSIQRTNAGYNGCNYAADCSTPLGFEETLNKNFPTSTAADFAPLEAGLIDVEQRPLALPGIHLPSLGCQV
jgi:hypothetical protein